MRDVRQTRQLLQETERRREELDSFNAKLKQELRQQEMTHEQDMATARRKMAELSNKLQGAERRIKRLDKRRSSGSRQPPPSNSTSNRNCLKNLNMLCDL